MIIAASQRQSSLLFEKVRAKMDERVELGKVQYKDTPTLTKLILDNGSRIYSLPAGRTGYFIRGYTIDVLIVDEAAYLPETVWVACTPMIAVSRKTRGMGWIIMLSTPFGKGGYFFDSFTDDSFKSFHVSSEDCIRIPKDFLRKEKARMTKEQYRQEYLGEFTDEWHQYFPTDLIKKQMTFISWEKLKDSKPGSRFYLGQDMARMGGDEWANVIVEMHKKRLKAVKCFARDRVSATQIINETQAIDRLWKFNKIFTDSGGLGGPILDFMQDKMGKRRVIGLDNATKRVQIEGEEKKRGILKEDLYSNVKQMLELGTLELISEPTLLRSMKSITYEYSDSGRLKIFGNYSHLTEALVRACWCTKMTGLRLFIK